MWNRVVHVCVAAVAVGACGTKAGPEDPGEPSPDAGSTVATSGSSSGSGSSRPPVSTPGAGTGSSGTPQTPPSSGSTPVGMPSSDGGGDAAGSTPPITVAGDPKIPAIMGTCPKLAPGMNTETIVNPKGGTALPTLIQAGTPGETKGALVFAWHGSGGTSASAMAGVPSNAVQDIMATGGIIVAPQSPNMMRSGQTDICPPMNAWYIEDLDTADLIVSCAIKNNNVDPHKIYATGCSAGGLMSGTMGLMRSEYVAAVAPNSGGINYMNSRMLSDKSRSPASFLMHGGSSDMVIISFAQSSGWYEDQAKMATKPGLLVDCNTGAGHCGAPADLISDSWTFMKAHPFGVTPEPYASGLPSGFPTYCTVVK